MDNRLYVPLYKPYMRAWHECETTAPCGWRHAQSAFEEKRAFRADRQPHSHFVTLAARSLAHNPLQRGSAGLPTLRIRVFAPGAVKAARRVQGRGSRLILRKQSNPNASDHGTGKAISPRVCASRKRIPGGNARRSCCMERRYKSVRRGEWRPHNVCDLGWQFKHEKCVRR